MLSERVDIASFSRLIIREPSGALISRFLSDVGGVGTVEVGGFCFLEFLGLHMGVRYGYITTKYYSHSYYA